MKFSAHWIEGASNAAPEERATVAELMLLLGNQNVTRHLRNGELRHHLVISVYPLVEGLVHDWWALFGARDREFLLMHYRTGYALPDVRFTFDGRSFEVSAHQLILRNPDLEFWAGASETMSRVDAEAALSGFIDAVLNRLASTDLPDTGAAQRWARIKASRADAEEANFCESAGALGIDPYAIDDASSALIENAAELFVGEALTEFLAGARNYAAERILHWVRSAEKRPKNRSRMADLTSIARHAAEEAPLRASEDGWALGYRRARCVRKLLNFDEARRIKSTHVLAKKFGATDAFAAAQGTDGIRALRVTHNDEAYIHLRSHGTAARADEAGRFSLARAIGDAACFPIPGRSAINELHLASRQAAGRAFAAEFLAPINEIKSMEKDGSDTVSMANEFAVSTRVIEHQLENAARIELACQE